MNTIDEAIAVLLAMKEGKTIQIKCGDGKWENYGLTTLPNFGNFEYRIAPSARLLTADELPDVIWLKSTNSIVRQVIGVDSGMLLFSSGPIHPTTRCCIEELHRQGVLWSDSRRGPWKSFETEVNP